MLTLNIDSSKVELCNSLAKQIADNTFTLFKSNTTASIERAVLRLLGVKGASKDALKIPYVNIFTEILDKQNVLQNGAAIYYVYLTNFYGEPSDVWIEKLYKSEVSLPDLHKIEITDYRFNAIQFAKKSLIEIDKRKQNREDKIKKCDELPTPWLYVIVATGNIYEDIEQAEMAIRQGADVIAVIRSTAQSLLDYVPDGINTEGIAGTYATQENFRLMREKLDILGDELGRYIRLTNYASGLCMPEIAAIAAIEGLDMLLCDSMYGILFRDINMVRTFTDQYFSRKIQAYAGIIINTGEDNYLTTSEQYDVMHTVLASHFINRQFALQAGLDDTKIGLGHAFEMDPEIEDGLLLSIADALLVRHCFPQCPIKYMPPTKHINGNIFFAHTINTLFNFTSIATRQHIHLVGVLSEAIHTPFIHERYLAIQNFKYILKYSKSFSKSFILAENTIIDKRAMEVLDKAIDFLSQIDEQGLSTFINNGHFAGVKRSVNGGKGYEGVIKKSISYFNPFEQLL